MTDLRDQWDTVETTESGGQGKVIKDTEASALPSPGSAELGEAGDHITTASSSPKEKSWR